MGMMDMVAHHKSQKVDFCDVFPMKEFDDFLMLLNRRLYTSGIKPEALDLVIAFSNEAEANSQPTIISNHPIRTVQLSLERENWITTTESDKKSLLIKAAIQCLKMVDDNEAVFSRVLALFEYDDALLSNGYTRTLGITIPQELVDNLWLNRWEKLTSAAMLEIGEVIKEKLSHRVNEAFAIDLNEYEPKENPLTILGLKNTRTGDQWNLVPGGEGIFGKDQEKIKRLARAWEFIEEEKLGPAETEELGDGFVFPARNAQVGAMLVLQNAHPAKLDWHLGETIDELKNQKLDLPTVAELTWIASGGLKSLFYWGDEIAPIFGDLYKLEDSEETRKWWQLIEPSPSCSTTSSYPILNRFGLCKVLSFPTICVEDSGSTPPRFFKQGGAATNWPWQGCAEWTCFVPGLIDEYSLGRPPLAYVRPIIRVSQ